MSEDEIVRTDHGFSKKKGRSAREAQELHKQRHVLLHDNLDELLADFLVSTGKIISGTTIWELLKWSSGQSQKPDPLEDRQDEA
jgi:hypothetical protein